MTEDAVRAHVGNKDFIQVRKMGFLFAINKHGGLPAEGLAVGDVVDVAATENLMDVHIVRVVKRAGE